MASHLEGLALSARERKNQENKQKLYDAAAQIMEMYDYNTVTIRNICKVSGVSYGSFYNLFDSKETFLRYYLTNDFTAYMEDYFKQNADFQQKDPLEKSVEIFLCCANYNLEKGLHFISSFYSTKNHSLFPKAGGEEEYSFTPLVQQGKVYLKEAKEKGLLPAECDVDKMICMYCYLFNGITFNWCLSQGSLDIVYWVKQTLQNYIDQIKHSRAITSE